jgi:hypothetical protein
MSSKVRLLQWSRGDERRAYTYKLNAPAGSQVREMETRRKQG